MTTLDELIDEEVGGSKPAQPLSSRPPPSDLDALLDEEAGESGYLPYTGESRFGNIVFRDATFGLGPRILAALETGSVDGPEYKASKERRFARNDAYSYDNPGSALAASVTGTLPTAFVPGLGAGRVANAAVRTGVPATGLSAGQRALRAIGMGREIGGVGHEAGVLGAKFSGLYGGLGSREETASGRAYDALKFAPLGYAFGRGTNAVMGPGIRAAQHVDEARRTGGNATSGARLALQKDVGRDGLTIDEIRQQVLPNMGNRRTAQDAVEAATLQYSPDGSRGSVGAMRSAYRNALREAGIDIADATADAHVSHIRRLLDNGQGNIPLNLPEVARQAGSRGQNLSWTQRVAAATPGESRERLFDAVTSRQESIVPTARRFVDQRIGNADLEDQLDDLIVNNRARERGLYDLAEGNEIPFDLRPLAEGKARAVAPTFARTKDREVYEEALDLIGNGGQPHTLQSFINANTALNDMIGESMVEKLGREVSTSVTAPLMELKKEAQEIVSRLNPSWKAANDATAGGRSAERMIEDVAKNLNINGRGPKARRIIKRVSTVRDEVRRLSAIVDSGEATPFQEASLGVLQDQLSAAQIGFARVMHDTLDGLGDTHDFSKYFLKGGEGASSGVRETMRQMMGEESYSSFMDMVKRGQMASTTFKNQFNSQTNPLATARDELDAEGRVAGFWKILGSIGSPGEMLKETALIAARRFNEQRNQVLGDYYARMTDNPADFLRMLREIEQSGTLRSPVFSGERMNAYALPAATGGAFSVAPISEQHKWDDKYSR